jgi:adenylosuccinate lyase
MYARDNKTDLKTVIINDRRVKELLSENEIESCFNIKNFIKNLDYIFKRVGIIL